MSRMQIVLVGCGSLFLLFVACAAFSLPRIEADLSEQVTALKDKANLFWVNIEVDGQHVTLSGTAPDYIARDRAREMAAMTWGVNHVDNQIRLVGESGTCQQDLDTVLAENRVEFEGTSDRIDASSYNLLAMLAAIARNCDARLQVIGHTDDKGSAKTNLALSQKRAGAVKTYLVRSGAAQNRIEAIGRGESMPVADNSTDSGRASNRRIEFRLVGLDS